MTRRFTPSEANRTLPLVKRIVADVLDRGRELRSLLPKRAKQGVGERIGKLESELRELMGELKRIGCSFKDFELETGLVDFPATIDGNDVLLCWRSDEPSVTWFHGYEDGFAGRQPIPAELLEPAPEANG